MINKPRNTTVDLFKIAAAFGVIALHVHSSTVPADYLNKFFWPLCVPFFYVISLAFFIPSIKDEKVAPVLKKTWQRLVIPYLSWTAIYVGLLLAKSIIVGGNRSFVMWRVLFYGESSLHLYYIPTLLLFQAIALSMLFLFNPKTRNLLMGGVIGIVAIVYAIVGDIYNCFGVSATGQIFGITLFLFAAFWAAPKMKELNNQFGLFILGIGLIVFAVVSNWLGYRYYVLSYPMIFPIGGIGLLLVSIGYPCIKIPSWMLVVSSTSYGVYLSHVLFLESFEFVIEKIAEGELYVNLGLKIGIVTGIFACGVLFTLIIRKNTLARKLLLGEK